MEGITKEVLARLLKDARLRSKMSVEEVATALKAYGYEIAPKSIYNYEKGINMPVVPMFIALCKIYGIDDLNVYLKEGYRKKVEVTPQEETLLACFRAASPELKDAALRMLQPAEKDSTASLVG